MGLVLDSWALWAFPRLHNARHMHALVCIMERLR